MFSNLFHLDHPVWVFMGRLADLALLTGIWFLCCIPAVTIGASTKALYTVAAQMARDEDGYTAASFFRAFRKDFKESTWLGMAVLALGGFLVSDLYVYGKMGGRAGTFLFTVCLILTVVFLMTLAYVYPLSAMTEYKGVHLVLLSFTAACKNPGWAILLAVIMGCAVILGIFVCAPLLAVGTGLAAYVQCKIVYFLNDGGRRDCSQRRKD